MLSKGYDLLLCSEDVDEFCLQIMHDYKEKEFKNINSGDLAWKPRMKEGCRGDRNRKQGPV